MTDIAVRVENLGKLYRIGQIVGYGTLRESLTNAVTAPFRHLRQPRATSHEPSAMSHESNYIWALKDVSFELKRGGAVGIIGRNGSGKTTILKILSRITAPTEGCAEIHGRVGSLLEVGIGFHPELTGRENIYLNGAVLGMKRAEVKLRFDEIVAFSEIEKFLDTPVKRYSSGMYVRLAFAVAAHLEPEVLIVDEVLAVGDTAFQKKCLGKMGDVARGGRTVLFVSHNLGAVQRLCQQTILLEKGRITDFGDSVAVCEKYLHSDIQSSSGMYKFDGGAEHEIQFLRAELLNSQGELTGTFRADESIKFRITYRIVKELSGVSIAINITDPVGSSLWGMSDLDIFPELYEKRRAGTWVYECIAPGNVLRPGTYMVALGAGSGSQYYHHPPLFPFEITTAGYWRKSYHYYGVGGGPLVVPMKAKMPTIVEEVLP